MINGKGRQSIEGMKKALQWLKGQPDYKDVVWSELSIVSNNMSGVKVLTGRIKMLSKNCEVIESGLRFLSDEGTRAVLGALLKHNRRVAIDINFARVNILGMIANSSTESKPDGDNRVTCSGCGFELDVEASIENEWELLGKNQVFCPWCISDPDHTTQLRLA